MENPKITFVGNNEEEIELPAKWVICHRCDGNGSIVNPAVDGNGLSREDFEEGGPEFYEDYMSGVYNVSCPECNGRRVVAEVDERKANPEHIKEYEKHLADEAQYRQICEMERRMGA